MKHVFSENNGEYLNKKSENFFTSSKKEVIQEFTETNETTNLINNEES